MIRVPPILPKNIEYGYCHCGCGEKTTISPYSSVRDGRIKGKPMKFISGHNAKGSFTGKDNPMWRGGKTIIKDNNTSYVKIKMREHPKSDSKGYVFEHVLVVEKAWGYPLPEGSVIHHVDSNGLNNNIANLMVFKNNSEHHRFHRLLNANKNS